MSSIAALAIASLSLAALGTAAHGQAWVTYRDMCDASAAVALDADHFAVASDETDALRIYQRGRPDPVDTLDLAKFLGARGDRESDLEGAATIGTRIYWIASHGRNSAARLRPNRYSFFATEIRPGSPVGLVPTGRPDHGLLDDLVASPAGIAYRLADAALRAPEAPGGLNVEGLAATPDGRLLIGFRNPIPAGRALIIPLENPGEIIEGRKARFGAPLELDLGGRGIRGIERIGNRYLLVAGPPADQGSFALYRWSGKAGEPAARVDGIDLGPLRPEALFAIPGTQRIQVLSDDGGVTTDGVACKDRPRSQRSFRSIVVEPAK